MPSFDSFTVAQFTANGGSCRGALQVTQQIDLTDSLINRLISRSPASLSSEQPEIGHCGLYCRLWVISACRPVCAIRQYRIRPLNEHRMFRAEGRYRMAIQA